MLKNVARLIAFKNVLNSLLNGILKVTAISFESDTLIDLPVKWVFKTEG